MLYFLAFPIAYLLEQVTDGKQNGRPKFEALCTSVLTFGNKRVCTLPAGLIRRAQGKPTFLFLTCEPGAACLQ